MKQMLLFAGSLLVFPLISNSQIDLMSIIEDSQTRERRVKQIEKVNETEDLEVESNQMDKEPEKIIAPLVSFGPSFLSASETMGFRPTFLANTELAKNNFGFAANLQFVVPDNQQFDKSRTGQSLMLSELSSGSFNIGFGYGVPNGSYKVRENGKVIPSKVDTSKDSIRKRLPRVGLYSNFHLRNNSLFNEDSTNGSVQITIVTFAGNAGIECIIFRDYLSAYFGVNYMSVVDNRANYKAYFSDDPKFDLWNFRGGVRVKFLEGKDGYKGLFVDASILSIHGDMKRLVGNNTSAIYAIKFGYQKKIAIGQRKFDKAQAKLDERNRIMKEMSNREVDTNSQKDKTKDGNKAPPVKKKAAGDDGKKGKPKLAPAGG